MSKIFELLVRVKLRKENFGGLVFLPLNGEIFQVNNKGYQLIEKLVSGKKAVLNSDKELTFWKELEERGIVKEVKQE